MRREQVAVQVVLDVAKPLADLRVARPTQSGKEFPSVCYARLRGGGHSICSLVGNQVAQLASKSGNLEWH